VTIIWTAAIGLVAGLIARLVTPGDKEPSGFLITSILGVMGAFAGRYLPQEAGWTGIENGAGLIAGLAGSVVILVIWAFLFRRRSSSWM